MRDLFIFLNKKLISCDTILPLAMDLHASVPKARISFVVTDWNTEQSIRRNSVLWDGIHSVGSVLSLSRPPGRNRLLSRMITGLKLARLALLAVIDRAVFFHFKSLNTLPLSVLYRLAPRRTYFCENDSYGFTQLMYDVTYHTSSSPPPIVRVPNANALIGFSRSWPLLDHPGTAGMARFVFGATRLRRRWLEFTGKTAAHYIDTELRSAGIDSAPEIFSVMLGTFSPLPYLRHPDTTEQRLEELLDVLARHAGNRPIMLKPHIVTDMEKLKRILGKRKQGQFVITHLHPMVLASRSRLFAANYYTTTLGDAASLGVPTIEFTDYTDRTLEITHGGSMRPEFVSHFINGDVGSLDIAVREILSAPDNSKPTGRDDDASGLIVHLSRVLTGVE